MFYRTYAEQIEPTADTMETHDVQRSHSWRHLVQRKLGRFGLYIGSAYSFDPESAQLVKATIADSRYASSEKER